MSKPPVRPKGWRNSQQPRASAATPEPVKKDDELPTHAAPSHLGAQVSQTGYRSGLGGFGFQQFDSWRLR